ncbi:hypothetical protein GCM10011614_29140 [Novosphingobium colocasiae]|uniref:Thiamine phosphate synthase/TenI domain-containing protein n=2 Tax=Novosphingobium colocasiae TaxID=1256513 RepID=A0A918PKQ5_9SPHN|nr:hypothetical protein GCM10011614_29140 [Novosphingobium colocasiae]
MPLPAIWLVTDERTDALLDAALARLPRGSGIIFRHYHLPPAERRARLEHIRVLARRFGHLLVLAGTERDARRAGAGGAYGAPASLGHRAGLLRLATAHSPQEMSAALRAGADAILLSPVFATRSHPGAAVLGPVRWRLLAARSPIPVIAMGGVDLHRARARGLTRWAAIDGLA